MRGFLPAVVLAIGGCDPSDVPAPSPGETELVARETPAILEYLELDEVGVSQHGRRVKLHGYVIRGTVERKPGTSTYRFALARRGARLRVDYTGTLPHDFADQREVVATGTLAADGTALAADEVVSKCPDDYEELGRITP